MSEREEEKFGLEIDRSFPEEEEEFTLGVSDEGSDEFQVSDDLQEDDLFSIADEVTVVLPEDEESETVEPTLESVASGDEADDTAFLFTAEDEDDVDDASPTDEISAAPKSSPAKLLMLVLLVLLAAALGFYFFADPGSEPAVVTTRTAKATNKQPIALPKKPLGETLAASSRDPKPAIPAAPAIVAAKDSTQQQPVAAVVAGEDAAAVVKPEAKTIPAPAVAAPQPAPEKIVVPQATPAKARVEKELAEGKKKSPSVAVAPRYQVQVGAFLLGSNLHEASKKLQALGFEARQSETTRKTSMVRLKYGQFNEAEGRLKLAELKAVDGDAFLLHEEGKLGVYAGSYLSLDKARHYADILWEKGIKVEEVTVEVEVPLHRLSFGAFPDKPSALAAAEKAKQAGLDAQIIAYRKL